MTYQVTQQNPSSNKVVMELNAAVCSSTFPSKDGAQKADLYECANSCNVLVAHNSCPPIHTGFVKTVSIKF